MESEEEHGNEVGGDGCFLSPAVCERVKDPVVTNNNDDNGD